MKKNDYPKDYFFYHRLFFNSYITDNKFKNIWNKIPKLSAHPPHFIQEKGIYKKLTNEVKEHIDNKKAYVYKLSWKEKYDYYNGQTNFDYLYSTIKK